MLQLALAQFRPRKGAYRENLGSAGEVFGRLAAPDSSSPRMVVFPEAAFTGYFLEGGVRDLAVSADQFFEDLSREHARVKAPPVDVVAGFYEINRNRLYNSALVASLGGAAPSIRHVHRKVFLPTYGVFDEERFVEPGLEVKAFDTSWGRAAVIVCEDAWHSLVPTMAALDGAQLLVIVSASPARGIEAQREAEGERDGRPKSTRRWERTVQDIASEHGIYVALCQLVGFEGGKAFPGGSIIADPAGEILVRAPLFEEAMIETSIDLEEITRVRADLPLLSDLEIRLPYLLEQMNERAGRREGGRAEGALGVRDGVVRAGLPLSDPVASRHPAIPPSPSLPPSRLPALLTIDCELTRRWLVEFIRDELTRRRGFSKAVVGLSGGVDSALVAFLAAEALGPDNVIAVRMPYRSSSSESLAHAELVITQLKIRGETVDISAGVDGLASALGDRPDPSRLGNMMARMRMITLFDRSAALRALPLGTGNKTERLFGYFTWHADDSPPVNPIGDLFKTQVWALARHMGVPDVIVSKPATADLIQGQTDEGDFGISYHRADEILHWLLSGHRPEAIVERGFTAEEVSLVRKRLDSTHWKRRLPTVAMLSQTAIGEYYLRPVDF